MGEASKYFNADGEATAPAPTPQLEETEPETGPVFEGPAVPYSRTETGREVAPVRSEPTGGIMGKYSTAPQRYEPSSNPDADKYFEAEDFEYNEERGTAGVVELFETGKVDVDSKDAEQIRDLVGSIARLYHYGDEDQQAVAAEMAVKAADVVPEEYWAAYGLDVTEDEKGFWGDALDKAKGAGGKALDWGFGDNPFGNYFGRPLAEALSLPQQTVMLTVSELKSGNVLGAMEVLAETMLEFSPSQAYEGDAVEKAMEQWDLNGDGYLEFAEMLGRSTNSNGRFGRVGGIIYEVANFLGGEVFDPLNYITFGNSAAVRGALKVADDVLGPGMGAVIKSQGLSALTSAQRAALRQGIEESLTVAFGTEGRKRTAIQALRRMDPADIVDEVTAKGLARIQEGLGVHFAGMRIPGSQAVRKLPGSRKVGLADPAIEARRMDTVASWLDDTAAKLEDKIDELAPGGNAPTGAQGTLFAQVAPNTGQLAAFREMLDKVRRAQVEPSGANLALLDEPGSAVWKTLGDDLGKEIEVPLGARDPLRTSTEVVRPGVAATVRGSKPGQITGKLFAPRAALRRTAGRNAADATYRAGSKADAVASNNLDEMLLRSSGAKSRAAKEQPNYSTLRPADGAASADNIVREALQAKDPKLVRAADGTVVSGKTNDMLVAARVVQLADQGLPDTARYLEILAEQRKLGDDAFVKGGANPTTVREAYFPRIMTEEGAKEGRKSAAFNERFGTNPKSRISESEQKFQLTRTFMSEASVESANKVARQRFGLPAGVNLFEEDALSAYAMRSRSAFTAAASSDMLDKVVRLVDDEGGEIAAWGAKKGDPKSAELRRLEQAHNGRLVEIETSRGTLHATNELADEIAKVQAIMYNDETLEYFRNKLNQWSQIWGTYATVPLSDGLGFHLRNAYGNLMLNMTAGVVNPAVYMKASRIQNAAVRARRAMKDTGVTFEEALASQGLNLSARNKDLLRGAREHGVIGTGFFDDLSPDSVKELTATWRTQNFSSNFITRPGRKVGTAVENNARLGHYIDRINKGDSAEMAGRSVRRYLFDYGDLTEFERRNLRSVSRFYTFMRKNTGLQAWAMVNNPAGLGRQLRAHRQLMGTSDGEGGTVGGGIPDWARGRGITSRNILGGNAVGLDSVFGAAMEPFDAALSVVNNIPGLKDFFPGEATGEEAANNVLGLFSGGPVALVDWMYEVRSGETWYGASTEDRGTEEDFRAIADVLGPLWGPIDRMVAEFTGSTSEGTSGFLGTGLGNSPTATQKDMSLGGALIKNLLGLMVVPLGDSAQSSTLYALNEELDAHLKAAEDRGIDIGGVQDLRRLGVFGPAPGSGSTTSRATSVILEESIAQMEAAGGTVTPEVLLELEELRASEADSGYQYSSQVDDDGEETRGYYTSRSGRAKDLAETEGWLNEAGNPSLDRRTKAAYNRANPNDPFLDDSGDAISYSEWEDWVDDSGVQYLDGGGFTTRSGRGRDLAEELGVISAVTGNPSLTSLVKAEYNRRNPDDPFLRDDGEAYDYTHVKAVFPGASVGEARDWLIERGADISPTTSSLSRGAKNAYNQANPNNPYYEPLEWLEQRQLPIEGVYTRRNSDTGETRDYYPEGMSAGNWWVGSRGPSALGSTAPSGLSVLTGDRDESDSSGVLSGNQDGETSTLSVLTRTN